MVAAAKSVVMAAGMSGKVKTAVTMVAIPVMMTPLGALGWGVFTVNNILCVVILILNLWSMLDYFMKNGKLVLEDM